MSNSKAIERQHIAFHLARMLAAARAAYVVDYVPPPPMFECTTCHRSTHAQAVGSSTECMRCAAARRRMAVS